MRVVSNTRYGGPHVLTLGERPRPTPNADEVLVEVHASVVTEGDRRLRAADFPSISALVGPLFVGIRGPRRTVGGTNFAGRVAEVGAAVTAFAPGDDVFGSVMHGAYAEYLVVSHMSTITKIPRNTTYAEAAAIPYGAATAWVFLRDWARLQPQERVLVIGASGGVGRMALQVAKHLGAHVTGVCSSDFELVRSLGADAVIDYRHDDFSRRPDQYDVIFDITEGDHFTAFRRSLTPKGRYLSLYPTPRALTQMLVTRWLGGPRVITGVAMDNPAVLREVAGLVDGGALRATIGARYPLERAADAHAHFETEKPHSTVVIDVVAPASADRAAAA